MRIVYYPDPVLQRRAEAVPAEQFDGLRELAGDMIEAMVAAGGVGLAAPQVARSMRLFVVSPTGQAADAMVFVNPAARPFGPIVRMEEGCLSLPGIQADISRPEGVRVSWTDLDGAAREGEFHELAARIVQHENDHLDGVLFFDRMTEADRLRIRPDLRAFEEQFHPA